MTEVPQRGSTAFLFSLAALLALAHAILGVTATTEKSVTADEIAYLTAGHSYNTRHDFRLQPENGILPQRWAALPEWLLNTPLPSASNPAWTRADVWRYGHDYFYDGPASGDLILLRGRAMMAVFTFATGVLIFCWSRGLYGWRGGFLALVIFCLCPSFLAHGPLATSDVPMTFFFLASVGAWWRHLRHPGAFNAAVSALVFALASVTKFSAVLLAPMAAVMAAFWILQARDAGAWRTRLLRAARSGMLHAAAAWLAIWAFYEFRYAAFAPGSQEGARFYLGDWAWITADLGWRGTFVNALRACHALPEAFLYGFTFVLQFAQQRSSFLNGEYSLTGWPEFFPLSFLMKTTVPVLLLSVVVLGGRLLRSATLSDLRRGIGRTFPLPVLFVGYWAVSLTSHLNIGQRHLLPIYPAIFICLGSLGPWLDWRRPLALFVLLSLAGWHAVESFAIRPHYLAYFNQTVGGPKEGWKHLVDSSLDWGQDLPALRQWLDQHAREEPVYVAYFGLGDLRHEGIRAASLPSIPGIGAGTEPVHLGSGIYAISATMLQQVYLPVRGSWNAAWEREYQTLRAKEPSFATLERTAVSHSADLSASAAAPVAAAMKRYGQLRFARLCYYLRVRRPEAIVGYSILVYRLNQAELDIAISSDLRALAHAIEAAGAHSQTSTP